MYIALRHKTRCVFNLVVVVKHVTLLSPMPLRIIASCICVANPSANMSCAVIPRLVSQNCPPVSRTSSNSRATLLSSSEPPYVLQTSYKGVRAAPDATCMWLHMDLQRQPLYGLWFRCCPFRVDVVLPVRYPTSRYVHTTHEQKHEQLSSARKLHGVSASGVFFGGGHPSHIRVMAFPSNMCVVGRTKADAGCEDSAGCPMSAAPWTAPTPRGTGLVWYFAAVFLYP